jgi:uncharacterized protein (DUF983 family)
MDATAGSQLRVTRSQIISRGFANRCPNCSNRSLFPPGSLRIRAECPVCEMTFDPGGGFWLGPLVINYTLTVVVFVSPLLLLGVRDVLPLSVAVGLAIAGGLLIPVLLYRRSWSWWLMIYFFLSPEKLPANGAGIGPHAQE